MTVFAPWAAMHNEGNRSVCTHSLVCSEKTIRVHTRDAQLETAVVRGIGGNQTSQGGQIWFTGARSIGHPLQRHHFAVSLHAFENTSSQSFLPFRDRSSSPGVPDIEHLPQ